MLSFRHLNIAFSIFIQVWLKFRLNIQKKITAIFLTKIKKGRGT
jgi:hypothetical protein